MKKVFCLLLFIPYFCNGQSINKLGIRYNYNHYKQINGFEIFHSENSSPTRLEILNLPEIALIFNGLSEKHQMELIFKKFRFLQEKQELKNSGGSNYLNDNAPRSNRYYNNLTLQTTFLGCGNTYRISKSKKSIFSLYANFLIGFSNLKSKQNEVNEKFTSPAFELGANLNFLLSERLSLDSRAGFYFSKYPKIAYTSTKGQNIFNLGLGLKYNLIKNKKFNYSI